MNRPATLVTIISTVLIVGMFAARVPAQPQVSIQTELLTEVRLLRQAMEGLAGTPALVQIATGRLQLQEQRTAAATARLEHARVSLESLNERSAQMSEMLKTLEARSGDTRLPPEQLEHARNELRMMTREAERLETERTRLMTAESDAAGAVSLEEGRSLELNRQLDELERHLAKPPR